MLDVELYHLGVHLARAVTVTEVLLQPQATLLWQKEGGGDGRMQLEKCRGSPFSQLQQCVIM